MGVKQWGYGAKFTPETGYPCESGGIIGAYSKTKNLNHCAATIMADSVIDPTSTKHRSTVVIVVHLMTAR